MSRVTPNKTVIVSLIAFLGAAALLGAFCRYSWLCGEQIGTYTDMVACAEYLKEHHERNGEYPSSFLDAMPPELRDGFRSDRWGAPYVYESSPDGYILVSLGRDGKRDGLDYWGVRDGPVWSDGPTNPGAVNILGQYDADQVVSDRGWHRHASP